MEYERGCNEVVRDGHLLVLGIEDALIGVRPHAIQAFDGVLSFKLGSHAPDVEMIAGVWGHHLRRENFLEAARNL
jgi:hypothetical protein